jgi:hypothetical protein
MFKEFLIVQFPELLQSDINEDVNSLFAGSSSEYESSSTLSGTSYSIDNQESITVDSANDISARFVEKNIRIAYNQWLRNKYPDYSENTLGLLHSGSFYLYNNECGISLSEALLDKDGFDRALIGINSRSPAKSAKEYIRFLSLFKEFLIAHFPKLLNPDKEEIGNNRSVLIKELLIVIAKDYANGFRFEPTAIRLLSDKTSITIDDSLQKALKNAMFCHHDNLYFVIDNITAAETQDEIVNTATKWLDEYNMFELSELYILYADQLDTRCISNVNEFNKFFEFLYHPNFRQSNFKGKPIVRTSTKRITDLFLDISQRIVSATINDCYGIIDENFLKERFPAFSIDLLSKVIKYYVPELVKTEINGLICFQTLDSLGLPCDFVDILTETLSQLNELSLAPTEDVLHAALSLKLGNNFKSEYSIPDQATYRRLISELYRAEPRREWKSGIFAEV